MTLAPGTMNIYDRVLKQFAAFASAERVTRLNLVDAGLLERYQAQLGEHGGDRRSKRGRGSRPNSPKTVRDKLKVVRSFLKWAVQRRMLAFDPAAGYRLPQGKCKEVKPYSLAERQALQRVTTEPWGDLFEFLALTGLRSGELCTLRKEDVDLDNLCVHIREKDLGGGKTWRPKHGKSRVVPLIPGAVEILQRVMTTSPGPWVFCNPDSREPGARFDKQQIWRQLQSAAKAAGIRANRVHAFRHGFCSMMADANLPPMQLMKIMGHVKLDTVLPYYHTDRDQLTAAVSSLDLSAFTIAPAAGSRRQDEGQSRIEPVRPRGNER